MPPTGERSAVRWKRQRRATAARASMQYHRADCAAHRVMTVASLLEPAEESDGGTDVTSINYYLSQMGILRTLSTRHKCKTGGSLEQIGNLHSASLTERGEQADRQSAQWTTRYNAPGCDTVARQPV